MFIVDSQTMAEIDKETIKTAVPGDILMENAGKQVCKIIKENYLQKLNSSELGIVVFAGPGNNGGDGFVIARRFKQDEHPVEVFSLVKKEKYSGDARINLNRFEALQEIHYINDIKDLETIFKAFQEKNKKLILVDAIFGTGLKRAPEGIFEQAINFINNNEYPVVSVDIASGINGSSGEKPGVAVNASYSVSFAMAKFAHFVYPGKAHTGKLYIVDIGIPPHIVKNFSLNDHVLTAKYLRKKLIKRKANSHKNTYGHVLAIAGNKGKAGAAALVSRASLRAGAGLSTLLVPECIYESTACLTPEVMVESYSNKNQENMLRTISFFIDNIKPTIITVGPGIGVTPENEALLTELLKLNIPILFDADAIKLLKHLKDALRNSKAPRILTPHPGEFAKLSDLYKDEIQKQRLLNAKKFATEQKVFLLLKGNDSIIVTADGEISINSTGNPKMANAGQGDALSGFIAGLIASGYPIKDALELAVYTHGRAGDELSKTKECGVLASDIIELFPTVLKDLRKS